MIALFISMNDMIENSKKKNEIVELWTTVKTLRNKRSTQSQLPFGGMIDLGEPPQDFFNLPFVLAFAVLDMVLGELMQQGQFEPTKKKNRYYLGDMMEYSKDTLDWRNYGVVSDGVKKRNDLAHHAELMSKEKCLKYIDAIERELTGWAIL